MEPPAAPIPMPANPTEGQPGENVATSATAIVERRAIYTCPTCEARLEVVTRTDGGGTLSIRGYGVKKEGVLAKMVKVAEW